MHGDYSFDDEAAGWPVADPPVAEPVSANQPCETCGGSGQVGDQEDCIDCAGTGTKITF
jgi:RecJ-like exonuclease